MFQQNLQSADVPRPQGAAGGDGGAAAPSVALHGLTKRFPGVLAGDDVDLNVDCGVDIASKPALLATVRNQLSERTGVIMTSESEDEMIDMCDRILVFYRGRVVRTLERGGDDFNVAELYKMIQGVTEQ